VIDSGSTDGTLEIARQRRAVVLSNPFTGFGDQRNFAIENAGGAPLWQLHLDADERLTPALDARIRTEVADPAGVDAFSLPNMTMLHGKWIRRSSDYPVYQTRLVNRDAARFVNHGHGQQESPGVRVRKLEEPYIHEAFINGMSAWIEKHNRYASQEVALEGASETAWSLKDLVSSDATLRRRAQRDMARGMPAAPLIRALYILLAKRGILDGASGIQFARMMAMFELMKQVKREEARAMRGALRASRSN
jgi:glycosyltransferase involved in cell wall biosynthesis